MMHKQCSSRRVQVTRRYLLFTGFWLVSAWLFGGPKLAPLPPIGAPSANLVASWYGVAHEGRKTASGQVFHRKQLTAAHRTARFGTRLLVLYKDQAVEVTVTDRGPYAKKNGRFSRDLDLSEAAARDLGMADQGVARVTIREIDYPTASDAALDQLLPRQSFQIASLD